MSYNMMKNKAWIIENIKALNISIIEQIGNKLKIKCNICGAIKILAIDSIYSNYHSDIRSMHGESCSKYFNDIGRKELGEKSFKKFREYYRFARERCCNKNSKDYPRYKGKMKFNDFVEYFKSCYEEYKYALSKYGTDSKLSIDRIDGKKGYEDGNVRFVPMIINLKNKNVVIPVICVNIHTLEVVKADSVHELCTKYFDENKNSAISESIKQNRIYNNTWKIFYTIKTQSTIESK